MDNRLIQSINHASIWPLQTCEMVHCSDERALFLPYGNVFP